MNIGCNEPITGGEREHFDGKKGSRLVFSASPCSSLPNCPKCGHNKKVFKAKNEYVCSEFHKTNAGGMARELAALDSDNSNDIDG